MDEASEDKAQAQTSLSAQASFPSRPGRLDVTSETGEAKDPAAPPHLATLPDRSRPHRQWTSRVSSPTGRLSSEDDDPAEAKSRDLRAQLYASGIGVIDRSAAPSARGGIA